MFRRSGKEKKGKSHMEDPYDREEPPPPSGAKQTIHVIFGGPEGGDAPLERRRWAQELHIGLVESEPRTKRLRSDPIAFTDDNLPSNPNYSTEALVVTIDIMGVDVR